jgi:peptidoglycan/LPS O-acetylase OafA/YrhL
MTNERPPGLTGPSRRLAQRAMRLVVILIVVTGLALALTTFVFHDSPAQSAQWLLAPVVAMGIGGIDLLAGLRRRRAKALDRRSQQD